MPPVAGALVDSVVSDAAAGKEVDFYWVGVAARHAGTIIHRWLQAIASGKFVGNTKDLDTLRAVSGRWARQMLVPEDEIGPVCDRVVQAIKGALADDKGRWILDGDGESELPISGICGGQLESVVIDRVRIDANGTHWIIDYKSSTHEGGNLDGFLQQEEDRYRPQLEKYASLYAALTGIRPKAALYFPLLQTFREVSVDSAARDSSSL